MKRLLKQNSGISLIEVLISVAVMALVVVSSAAMLLNNQFLASYARHKMQAMYAAQTLIETYRRQTFAATTYNATSPVTLDAINGVTGTAKTKVTNIDPLHNTITIEIDWTERGLAGTVTMKEYFTTDIANDPIPN